ncbi:MAG: SRPBCC family protein [Alphaproteobacteria bacterium]
MAKFSVTTKLAVPADQVWQIVTQFDGLPDWHPGVEKSEVETEQGGRGTVRRVRLAGGTVVVERLTKLDETGRVFGYEVTEGPPPFKNHRATLRVKDADGGCEVEWSAEFDGIGPLTSMPGMGAMGSMPGMGAMGGQPDMVGAMRAMFESGMETLRKMFGG